MSEYRLSKGETEHYTSLEELREAWGLKPIRKQTKDKDKLKKQRENFSKHHLCKGCKQPMVYIGGSVMACQNPDCKGIKHEKANEDGNTVVSYSPSYDLLDDYFAEVANNIFSETR